MEILLSPPALAQESPASNSLDSDAQELLDSLINDPDIGPIPLRIPEAEPEAEAVPIQLVFNVQYAGNSNTFFEDLDQVSDSLLFSTVTLQSQPRIGSNAFLLTSFSGSVGRYATESSADFNLVRGSVGVYWNFAPDSFTRFDIDGQSYTNANNGDQILNDVSAQIQVGQFQSISDQLRLNYFYQLRRTIADPDTENRLGNSLNVGLEIPFADQLTGSVNYQLLYETYSISDREDLQNQVSAQLRYTFSDQLSLNGFAAYTRKASSQDTSEFEALTYGIGVSTSFSLSDR